MKKLMEIRHALPTPVQQTKKSDKTRKLVGMICLFGLFGASIAQGAVTLNRIQKENALLGNSLWNFRVLGSDAGDNLHDLEGYADKDSVNIGTPIKFYVNSNSSRNATYTLTIYRLGWYGGMGARKMSFNVFVPNRRFYTSQTVTSVSLPSIKQTLPVPNPVTGEVSANWVSPYTINIPSDWTSGMYVASIVGDTTKDGQFIPFVVRDINRTSDYLFQSSTTTWQAYNGWGGKSLYGFNSVGGAARKVSFNRPYDVGAGMGSLRGWEINMLYFMEREGYDVTYQSDTDTHVGNGGLLNHKAILSVGHDEYWSKAMRDNFENAQKHGIGLGFFGGNIAYWQIRMENNNRTIVGYKDNAQTEDPYAIDTDPTNDYLITSRWRNGELGDPRKGANRPENALIGVMYAFASSSVALDHNIVTTGSDPKLADALTSHWAYSNTNLPAGSSFPSLVGYEADRIFDNGKTPSNLEVLAASPVPLVTVDHNSPASQNYDPANPKSHVTIYTKTCSLWPCQNPVSTVFAAGSLQWVWGLDTQYKYPARPEIPAVQQITRNVLARMVNRPLP